MATQLIAGPGDYQQDEAEAAADVEPGELLELTATDRVQPHSEVPDLNGNGSALPRFAIEDRNVGKTIDDTYTYNATDDEGENVHFARPLPGTRVQAWLAAGETVSRGDPLESAGNGALQLHTGLATTGDGTGAASETVADNLVVAEAAEDLDNSTGTDPVRIWVEV